MRFTTGLRWRTVKGEVGKNPVFHTKAGFFIWYAAEKRPAAAFPSSFVAAAYVQVRLTPQDFGGLASGHF